MTFTLIQKISILLIHQQKLFIRKKNIKHQTCILEGSCDIKDWSNGFWYLILKYVKKYFKV